MVIKCVIIDDEPLAIKVIEQHILQIPDLKLIATFENAMDSMEILQSNEVDLIFLDIHMPLLTGIDFVKNTKIHPKVIFTTAYREYAIESYELSVIDYLLKPISFTRFYKAINKFKEIQNSISHPIVSQLNSQADYIYVNANKKYLKIQFSDILYVDSIKDYIRIHTDTQSVVTKDRISAFTEKLPSNFIRVHRSYIVNTEKITAFTAKDIEIGKIEVPIGDSYKEVVKLLKE